MTRAYDDNGNVVDLVEWEKQIRADAIEEYRRTLSDICCRDNYSSAYLYNLFKRIAEQLKEQKNG